MIEGDACVSTAGGPGVCTGAQTLSCSPLASCLIGGVRVRERERDGTGCRVCLPSRRPNAWSFLPDGTTCLGGGCDGGGTCEPACEASPCAALAPRIDAVEPAVIHARLDTHVWLRGARLAGASAVLIRGGTRIPLSHPLSRDDLLRLTVPEGLEAGAWDLEVTGVEGVSTKAGAVQVTGDPLTVTVIDVGQGDASLIRAPSGRTMLIDGGVGSTVRLERLSHVPNHTLAATFRANEFVWIDGTCFGELQTRPWWPGKVGRRRKRD
jgi:hypothetical protein